MGSARTHYDVLGVDRTAEDQAVRRAWKVLVQVWHPDRFSGDMRDEAERQTQCINEAWTALRDPARRAAYNRRIDGEQHEQSRAAAGSGPFRASPFGMRNFGPQRTYSPPPAAAPAPPEVRPLGVVAAAMAREFACTVRQYPRITAAAVALWVVVFGGGWLLDLSAAGPPAPTAHVIGADSATGPDPFDTSGPAFDPAFGDAELGIADVPDSGPDRYEQPPPSGRVVRVLPQKR